MFRIKAFFLYLIAGLVVLPWNETSAQQRALLSIQILATVDYPGQVILPLLKSSIVMAILPAIMLTRAL